MTIEKRSAPEASLNALAGVLDELFEVSDTSGGGGESLLIREPIPVYTLDLDDAARPAPLENAKQIGWRYPLQKGVEHFFADMDSVVAPESQGSERFYGITEGTIAEGFEKQLSGLHREQLSAGRWDLRVIEIPSLHVGAGWLAGVDNRTQTRFYSYLKDKELGGKSDEASFLEVIGRRAAERLSERKDIRDLPFTAQ